MEICVDTLYLATFAHMYSKYERVECVVCSAYLLTADYGGRYREIISSLHSLHGNRWFPIESMKQDLFDPWWKSEELQRR